MSTSASRQLLPRSVDALKLCQQQALVAGFLPLAGLRRLSEALCCAEGEAEVELEFRLDEQARKIVHGHLKAVMPMVCQRCLEQMKVPVDVSLSLALVWSDEQAARLPRSLDPVLMESQELDLHGLLEEELLLALPLVPHHEPGVCRPPPSCTTQPVEQPVVRKDNPFQVLAELKQGVKNIE